MFVSQYIAIINFLSLNIRSMNDLTLNRDIGIFAATTDAILKAEKIASQLGLPLIEERSSKAIILEVNCENIALAYTAPKSPGATFVDFVGGKMGYRSKNSSFKDQDIVKACGIKKGMRPSIIDATAGLGRDGFILASTGCKVTLLERNPIIATLLEDGIRRAHESPTTAEVAANIEIHCINSSAFINAIDETNRPDVIYLDPMYPHRTKSSLVKKEMRVLREVVGDDYDADELLQAALNKALKRVVVKRPKGAEHLADKKPSMSFDGKSTRFDVYLIS